MTTDGIKQIEVWYTRSGEDRLIIINPEFIWLPEPVHFPWIVELCDLLGWEPQMKLKRPGDE